VTVHGAASADVLIPGDPAAIRQAGDTAAAGIEPARHIQTAWQNMRLPGWEGQAATAWHAFTPQEAAYTGKASDAMRTVASAMTDYQAAFAAARAEAEAAISDAQAAERLTQNALNAHETATQKAQAAKPGTPDAKVPTYRDPGAVPLQHAQARLDRARAALQQAGDAAAARINSAALTTSNVQPTIVGAGNTRPATPRPAANVPVRPKEDDDNVVFEFLKGIVLQALEDLLALVDLANPISQGQHLFELLEYALGGPEVWEKGEAAKRQAWADGTYWDAFKNAFLAWDLWESNPPEAAGRVTFTAGSLVIGVTKAAQAVKASKVSPKGPGSSGTKTGPLSKRQIDAEIDKLKSSGTNLKVHKKTGTTQVTVGGGYSQAMKDFEALTKGITPWTTEDGVTIAKLPDGRVINVRNFSSRESTPTLEIYDPSTDSKIKFRY
jgi:hypothetical protein